MSTGKKLCRSIGVAHREWPVNFDFCLSRQIFGLRLLGNGKLVRAAELATGKPIPPVKTSMPLRESDILCGHFNCRLARARFPPSLPHAKFASLGPGFRQPSISAAWRRRVRSSTDGAIIQKAPLRQSHAIRSGDKDRGGDDGPCTPTQE